MKMLLQRVKSPPLKRRATFPVSHVQNGHGQDVPELMTDYSNSSSNSDNDMSMDQDMDMGSSIANGQNNARYEEFVPRYDYEYGMSGSGGIGFGPGAEEDDDFTEEMMGDSCE